MPNPITVIFHLTGLLLVVPPKASGDPVYVVTPDAVGHWARIGFGAPDKPGLCERPYRGGICYVDMGDWKLSPVGSGGTPATPTIAKLPPGVINLTRGSGGHTVDLLAQADRVISIFQAGAPSEEVPSCSLGDWVYLPFGQVIPEVVPLASVLYWEMKLMQTSLDLVFTNRLTGSIETVTLSPSNGRIDILVAHVDDLRYLPPARPRRPAPPALFEQPDHFHALYGPLDVKESDRRRLPRFLWSNSPGACPVQISTQRAPFFEAASIDTYSCMLAAAEAK